MPACPAHRRPRGGRDRGAEFEPRRPRGLRARHRPRRRSLPHGSGPDGEHLGHAGPRAMPWPWSILAERDFGREDYALYHPAGSLGRKLMRVGEIMRKDAEPAPGPGPARASGDALEVMGSTPGRPGAALVVDGDGPPGGHLHRRRPPAPAQRARPAQPRGPHRRPHESRPDDRGTRSAPRGMNGAFARSRNCRYWAAPSRLRRWRTGKVAARAAHLPGRGLKTFATWASKSKD